MTALETGIYIHWPFCQAKCPYCDFNSHVVARINQSAWRAAYTSELQRARRLTGNRVIRSIFFGGGTPSMMDPATVESIIFDVQQLWTVANDVEITLEANPTSVEAERFAAYRAAGVDRISIGIQSLRANDLKRLGRLHNVDEARRAFDIARATFDRVSFDLIYARQNQSLKSWESELAEALAMAADHLSLYQLTVEPGTAFGDRHARGALRGLPHEDLSADMFELTQSMTGDAGMPAYEVSNHARPGSESRHNMLYWTGGDYIGIGPGAHGRITTGSGRLATETVLEPVAWLTGVRNGTEVETITRLDPETQAVERLMMGLRISAGVPLDAVASLNGIDERVKNLEELGLVDVTADRLKATQAGRPLLNAILRQLVA